MKNWKEIAAQALASSMILVGTNMGTETFIKAFISASLIVLSLDIIRWWIRQ